MSTQSAAESKPAFNSFTIRVPQETYEKLTAIAAADQRSLNFVANHALATYVRENYGP